jgi:chromosome segregation ATPase
MTHPNCWNYGVLGWYDMVQKSGNNKKKPTGNEKPKVSITKLRDAMEHAEESYHDKVEDFIDNLEDVIDDLKSQVDQLTLDLHKEKNKPPVRIDVPAEVTKLEALVDEQKTTITNQKRENTTLKKDRDKLKSDLVKQNDDSNKTMIRLKSLSEKSITEYKSRFAKLQQENNLKNAQIKELRSKVRKLQKEVKTLKKIGIFPAEVIKDKNGNVISNGNGKQDRFQILDLYE